MVNRLVAPGIEVNLEFKGISGGKGTLFKGTVFKGKDKIRKIGRKSNISQKKSKKFRPGAQ